MVSSQRSSPIPVSQPTIYLPIEVIAILGVCLPAATIYICIISSFFSNADKIEQFSIPSCPGVKSGITPVSDTIATWSPQRQLWMLSLLLHFPARTILMMMIPHMWSAKCAWRYAFYGLTSSETLSLAILSLFHRESDVHNYVHLACFGLWGFSTMLIMGMVVHIQRVTGYYQQEKWIYRLWLIKVMMLCTFILCACAMIIFHILWDNLCSTVAFTCFVVGEYVLIALNPCFWTIVIFEFRREFEGFQVVSVKKRSNKQGYSSDA